MAIAPARESSNASTWSLLVPLRPLDCRSWITAAGSAEPHRNVDVIYLFDTSFARPLFFRPPPGYPQHIHKAGLDMIRDHLVQCTNHFSGRPFRPSLQMGALAMTISRFAPPLDYLQAASRSSLQSFELARLNHAANLRQEIAALIDQWIQEASEALVARWMLDHRKSLQSSPISTAEVVRTLVEPATALFPETQSLSELVPAPPRFARPRTSLRRSIARKPQKQRQSAAG